MPGTFRRGRWECWDFKDVNPTEEHGIIEYGDKTSNGEVPNTVPVAAVSPTTEAVATLPSVQSAGMLVGSDATAPVTKEVSTIVVTSIAPAPTTPSRELAEAQRSTAQQIPPNVSVEDKVPYYQKL